MTWWWYDDIMMLWWHYEDMMSIWIIWWHYDNMMTWCRLVKFLLVKFSLLIFNSEKYDGNSSNEIINTYLEGGIDRIEVNKKDLVILDGEEKSEQLVKIRKKENLIKDYK